MAKDAYEKHVEDLIKVRSEIRQALECYKARKYAKEVYHMCRAKAMADALEISNDEFLEHKRLVELEEGMQDCLIDGGDTYYTEWLDNDIYIVLTCDCSDDEYMAIPFRSLDNAKEQFKKELKRCFKMDGRTKDSYGETFEDCMKHCGFFVEETENHGDIRCMIIKEKIQ